MKALINYSCILATIWTTIWPRNNNNNNLKIEKKILTIKNQESRSPYYYYYFLFSFWNLEGSLVNPRSELERNLY